MRNERISQVISYIPVPWICNGKITGKVEGSPTYWVRVENTPLGALNADINAVPIYQPGGSKDYKPNDHVKVLLVHHFNIDSNQFEGVARMYKTYILGLYEPEAMIDTKIQNPITEKGNDRTVISHENSQGAIVMTDNYEMIQSPGGAVSKVMKAFGVGVHKNCEYTKAQNFHRIISHSDEKYFSREHFGLFDGKTLEDEQTNVSPIDFLINYRRFVQQTKEPDKWVSLCEGAYAPWVGANNSNTSMIMGKDVLFTKIINNQSKRLTIEMGEPGQDFFLLRIDDIKIGEYTAPTEAGATPGVIGNKFKIGISDEGAVEIYAAGKGIPISNIAGFKLSLSADGELKIQCAKKITITHGDADENINSISLDPVNGVEIKSLAGFKVNGKKLVNENFLDWLSNNQASLVSSVLPPGSPCPMFPATLALFQTQKNLPDSALGFLTASVPVPATGVNLQTDLFETVPVG